MNGLFARPRLIGLLCGILAVAIGLFYLSAAGAPPRYLLVNLAALVLGAAAWLALGRAAASRLAASGPAVLVLAVPLLLTALFGVAADGASRWLRVGALSLQVSLIVLPLMLVLFARRPDRAAAAGMIVAALALALQPDRAMAGILSASLLALALARPGRHVAAAAAAALLAFGWTLVVPDSLPPVPFVDRILFTAFEVHPLAGAAVTLGAGALLVPAVIAALRGADERPALIAFGACWLGIIFAAVAGNYPTPLVGYGGSAILGYLLSVALLPGAPRASAGSRSAESSADERTESSLEGRVPRLA